MKFATRRALLACAAFLFIVPAMADSAWPDKPIRFVVDNRAGGNGNIGLDVVAKSRPDGYTIGMGQTANLAINPTLFPKMPYDALNDLTAVCVVASQPVVLIVRADAPFKTLAELIAAAKARPGEVRQALAGTGTLGHMAGEVLAKRAGG